MITRNTTLFVGPYAHNLGSHNSLACWRIVRWICKNVEGCDFVQYGDFSTNDCHRNVKNIVYFYSSFYAKFDEIINVMQKHPDANLYWLYNEYTLALNSTIFKYFKQRGYSVITNLMQGCAKDITQTAKKINTVNTNVTAYRYNAHNRPWDDKQFDLIYYGSYRENRTPYIRKYFQDAFISTTEKNENLFTRACNVDPKNFIGILVWTIRNESRHIKEWREVTNYKETKIYPARNKSTLDMFKFSVYVEDQAIHQDKFNNLSDRFYECVSHGVLLFFDENCRYNMSKSKYRIPDYFFVSTKDELQNKMKEMEQDAAGRDEYFRAIKQGVRLEEQDFAKEIRKILNG